MENGGHICFCAGWHAVEGGRNPLATLSFCSLCGPESMNRYVHMYEHTNTQSAPWAVFFSGGLAWKEMQIHKSMKSLKLKSFLNYIAWPLRNLFSSSQLANTVGKLYPRELPCCTHTILKILTKRWETSLSSFQFGWKLWLGCRVRYYLRYKGG